MALFHVSAVEKRGFFTKAHGFGETVSPLGRNGGIMKVGERSVVSVKMSSRQSLAK